MENDRNSLRPLRGYLFTTSEKDFWDFFKGSKVKKKSKFIKICI